MTIRAACSIARMLTPSSSRLPLHLHAKYFLDSLAAGKDVYCEKTMTWDIPEAVECLRAAQNSKQVVQIGLQHESSGELADARKWYEARPAGQGDDGRIVDEPQHAARSRPVVSRDSCRLQSAARELGPVPGQPSEDRPSTPTST